MKKTILVFIAAFSLSLPSWGQGSVAFVGISDTFGGEINPTFPTFNFNCTTPFGVDFLVQGYVGLSFDSLSPVGQPFPLIWDLDSKGNQVGLIGPRSVRLENGWGLHLGQFNLWEAAAGNSHEEAVAAGGKHGKSNIFLIDAVIPPGPSGPPMGLETICIVPEPSSGMLIFGGALFWGLWRWKVRKR